MAMRSPITTERQNIQILRESGFTQQQAEAVATVVRRTLETNSAEPTLVEVIQKEQIAAADARVEEAKAETRRTWRLMWALVGLAGLLVILIRIFQS